MHYLPGREGTISVSGKALEADHDLSVLSDTVLQIKDLGELTVHPGDALGGAEDVGKAKADLEKALSPFGCETIDEAAAAHRKRKEASECLTHARARLNALAPNGIEELQRQLAAIPEQGENEDIELPAADDATRTVETAREKASELATKLEAARERLGSKRTARAEAAVRMDAAVERLAVARAALERLPSRDEAALAQKADEAGAAEKEVAEEFAQISAVAPDVEATAAALTRAQSIADGARKKIEDLRPALAALNERIAGNSGEAVEERLQETEEKLEEAQKRLVRIAREVDVLQRLQTALEDARSKARDRYFAPIAGELRPLLNLLWPDADLNWADDTLLPQSLTRNGQEEPVDILSGGTQEQIALLVRLAFARLLVKDGRHAPVILDDALVFSDDDRIERMFDALHRQASDLQIIVLSCRQRAFRDLGGTALAITGQEAAAPDHANSMEATHGR
jgi:DNA repair exonuclease SbcCD ATPase subunit